MLPKTEAAKYAAAHSNTTLLPNGKIRFDQTGMEFPSTVTPLVLEAYANGKAFRRAVARRSNEAYDFSVHEPYIIPHRYRDQRHFLYCTLTASTLPRDREVVQRHVSAVRFRSALSETQEAKNKQHARNEKRLEVQERARASKSSQGEQDVQLALEESPEDVEDRMDEGNDILEGIMPDDDGMNGNDNTQGSREPKRPLKCLEEKSSKAYESSNTMKEDVAGEKDAFWTRGRKSNVSSSYCENVDDDDDDDEWREPSRREPSRRERLKNSTKKVLIESAEKTIEVNSGLPRDAEKEATVTGKRNRVQVQIPKKARRARQRRKSTQQTQL